MIEGLRELRVVLEPNEHGIASDLRWEGAMPAFQEPRQLHPQVRPRALRHHALRPDRLLVGHAARSAARPSRSRPTAGGARATAPGACARSASPSRPGIRQGEGQMDGMWNYAPMQFHDYSILYMCHERDDGERALEEARAHLARPGARAGAARPPRARARARAGHAHRRALGALLPGRAGRARFEITVTPLIECYVGIGTGYGFDADWRHGMYQGPLVVQGVLLDTEKDRQKLWGSATTSRASSSATGRLRPPRVRLLRPVRALSPAGVPGRRRVRSGSAIRQCAWESSGSKRKETEA